MRAFVLKATGGPELLQFADIEIEELKPTEVRIRQSVAGVNFVDIYHRTGIYPRRHNPPFLGVEGAGIIGGRLFQFRDFDFQSEESGAESFALGVSS